MVDLFVALVNRIAFFVRVDHFELVSARAVDMGVNVLVPIQFLYLERVAMVQVNSVTHRHKSRIELYSVSSVKAIQLISMQIVNSIRK